MSVTESRKIELREDGLYHCPYCEYKNEKRNSVASHMVSHPEARSGRRRDRGRTTPIPEPDANGLYHCPHCEQTFESASQIRGHYSQHKTVACEKPGCDWTGSPQARRWHKAAVHGELEPSQSTQSARSTQSRMPSPVDAELETFIAPVRARLEEMHARKLEIETAYRAERDMLDEGIRKLDRIVRAAVPHANSAEAKGQTTKKKERSAGWLGIDAAKLEEVERWIRNRPDPTALVTAPDVRDALGMKQAMASRAMQVLRDREVLRLMGRRPKEGRMGQQPYQYKLWNPNGGIDGSGSETPEAERTEAV